MSYQGNIRSRLQLKNILRLPAVPFFLLILLSAFSLFYNLRYGSLAAWDEAIFGEVAREIVIEGKGWLTLHFNDHPWFHKPPLFIWLIAIAYKIIGVNEFAVRVWSALFGFGIIILLYFLAKELFLNERIAFFSSLILMGFSEFVQQSRMGMMDAPLTFFVLLGIYFFWIGRKKGRYLLYIGIATGIAFMIKSFAAFQIPIALILFSSLAGEGKKLLNTKLIYGFLIGFLICLPWHLYQYIEHGGMFINEYFFRQIVQRTFEPFEQHEKHILYYFSWLVLKNIPLGTVGLLTVPYILFSSLSERSKNRKAFLLIITTATAILMLFTYVSTKHPWYIMPAYPFLSLSIAVFLDLIISKMRYPGSKLLVFVILVTLLFNVFIVDRKHKKPDYSRELKKVSLYVKDYSSQEEPLFSCGIRQIAIILFYSERKICDAQRDELLTWVSGPGTMILLMSKKDDLSEELNNKKYGLTILKETEQYILYKKRKS